MSLFNRKKVISRIAGICRRALSEHGFEGSGRTWKLISDEHARLVNLQTNRYDSSSTLTFTFNLGVFFPSIYTAENDSLPDPPLQEIHCCPRERIGSLFFTGDKWWEINWNTDESEIEIELLEMLTNKAVPWLMKFETMDDVFQYFCVTKQYREATLVAFALTRDDVGVWLQKALSNAPTELAKRGIEIWARDHGVVPITQ